MYCRSSETFFKPTADFEITGQVGNVCFLEGLVYFKDKWLLYYGTADSKIAVAVATKYGYNTHKKVLDQKTTDEESEHGDPYEEEEEEVGKVRREKLLIYQSTQKEKLSATVADTAPESKLEGVAPLVSNSNDLTSAEGTTVASDAAPAVVVSTQEADAPKVIDSAAAAIAEDERPRLRKSKSEGKPVAPSDNVADGAAADSSSTVISEVVREKLQLAEDQKASELSGLQKELEKL